MKKSKESGQVLIIYALVLVALLTLTGVAVDGSLFYLERRKVQNVADLSAIAGAYAKCSEEDIANAILNIADENGYDNNGTSNSVDIHIPPIDGEYAGDPDYIQVNVSSTITPFLIQIARPGDLTVSADAVAICDTEGGSGSSAPEVYTAFGGDKNCWFDPIVVSGNNNVIDGVAYSNKDIRVSGNNNVLDGPASSVGSVLVFGNNNETNGPVTEGASVIDWPFDIYNLDDYKPGGYYDLNDPNYHYNNNAFHFSGNNFTIPEGIYVAQNQITVSGNRIFGNVTFIVLGTGGIHLSGNQFTFTPYADNLFVYSEGSICSQAAFTFSGNTHEYSGIIMSPKGNLTIAGNTNTSIDGCLWGASITMSGNSQYVGNCADYVESSTPTIKLME
jgi:formylmethanofuran dehydrogenase subunit C